MKQDLTSINDDKIKLLTLDLINYIQEIMLRLNRIEDLSDKTSNVYDCKSGENFRNKIKDLKLDFMQVKENLMQYTEELIIVKNNINDFDLDLSSAMKKAAQDLKKDASKIEIDTDMDIRTEVSPWG